MNVIVTTTINPPNDAIQRFDQLEDWMLVVVGDVRTPEPYSLNRGLYLSPAEQEGLDRPLSDLIGWNTIQRRNLGFLWAWRAGAKLIATVDDDNHPYPHWGQELYLDRGPVRCPHYGCPSGVFDPLAVVSLGRLWHRGYPLDMVMRRLPLEVAGELEVEPDVQANLWDGDPDVDAVARLTCPEAHNFETRHVPFASRQLSPFNSQNTILTRRVLPRYFMFPGIGRADDIWASYYLQACGASVLYGPPTVRQVRNLHNLLVDFEREVKMQLETSRLLTDLQQDPERLERYLPVDSWRAFVRYRELMV